MMENNSQQIPSTDSKNDPCDNNFAVKLLLHYRHLLRFLREKFPKEIDRCLKDLKTDFNNNLHQCEQLLQDFSEKDDEFKKVYQTREKSYKNHKQMMILDDQLQLTKSDKIKNLKKPKVPPQKSKKTNSRIQPKKKSVKSKAKKDTLKRKKNDNSKKNDDDKKVNAPTPKVNDHVPNPEEEMLVESIPMDATMDSSGILIQHICSYDGCRFKSLSREKVKKHETLGHSKINIFNCSEEDCEEKFTSHYDYDNHLMQFHLVFQCTIAKCGIKFKNRPQLSKHMRSDHGKEYLTCFDCNTQYSNRDSLRKHVYFKHETGEYKCSDDKCDFVASLRIHLDQHTKQLHRDKKCPYPGCERVVPGAYLRLHLRKHKRILSYICYWPDCGKKFIDSKSLKDHVRIHVNFKRYRCKWPDCVYACEQQTNMITHVRVKHLKLPQTKKRQQELNISMDSYPNPRDFIETVPEDIFLPTQV